MMQGIVTVSAPDPSNPNAGDGASISDITDMCYTLGRASPMCLLAQSRA